MPPEHYYVIEWYRMFIRKNDRVNHARIDRDIAVPRNAHHRKDNDDDPEYVF